jgi:para-nitrobenzyl esterase
MRATKHAIAALACLAPLAARAQPVATTAYGQVQGTTVGTVNEFLGIPYAQPPVGSLRWYPPQAPANFTGTFQATQFASPCPQGVSQFGRPSTNEDCLYLNIYTPASATPGARLPVMVWIHGGAFITGEGMDYDGSALASQANIIVVTINYRLGILGFLAQAGLAVEDPNGSTGNYGLQDQQAALAWVKQNIAGFGGNPARMTIFGESAGGASVEFQLVSPIAPTVSAAIIESGAYAQALPTRAQAEATGDAMATGPLGCAPGTDAAIAACLRSLTAAQIVAAVPPQSLSISPNVDGTVLMQQPLTAYATGAFQHVPIINGTNHDEYRLFVALDDLLGGGKPSVTAASYLASVSTTFGSAAPAVLAQYPISAYPSAEYAYAALVTDSTFACGAHLLNGLIAQYATLYSYELNDPHAPDLFLPFDPDLPNLGDSHAAELPYLFPALNDPLFKLGPYVFSPSQAYLASTMRAFWTSLARTGHPVAPRSGVWQPYGVGNLVLSLVPPAPVLESNFVAAHHCAFWNPILLSEAGLPADTP